MTDAFEQFQARVRASDRMLCEADIYWRANRWDEAATQEMPQFLTRSAQRAYLDHRREFRS
ncbi:hypothetical protein QA639_21315 [Bradyrhizobium pachyrhizi]|uniref:hypothetical protein n=1 Tax=Bradyrhizobium pachyrhizi TaxID=280333 RepID=UPI0024B055DE|nr:hypothetical protein [Bradyrhizobium pachyrhizi]WFU52250.1 hypothetical protein QA639_21315 [Bradyrhizobium pachyrhizi]